MFSSGMCFSQTLAAARSRAIPAIFVIETMKRFALGMSPMSMTSATIASTAMIDLMINAFIL